ncbi:hypothetical protein EDB85DRAFT_1895763 [Lactarius pseudohatsudake]|nr:hypothetical protein EDB85DRAFT_1895763 [Lactarius pseudohatsudake]
MSDDPTVKLIKSVHFANLEVYMAYDGNGSTSRDTRATINTIAVHHISGRPTEIGVFHRKNYPLDHVAIIVVWREFDRVQDWVLTGPIRGYKVGHDVTGAGATVLTCNTDGTFRGAYLYTLQVPLCLQLRYVSHVERGVAVGGSRGSRYLCPMVGRYGIGFVPGAWLFPPKPDLLSEYFPKSAMAHGSILALNDWHATSNGVTLQLFDAKAKFS